MTFMNRTNNKDYISQEEIFNSWAMISNEEEKAPKLSIMFNVIGAMEIIGGIILFIALLPDPKALEWGESYRPIAYLPSITWFVCGLISGLIFFAIGEILQYLKRIWLIQKKQLFNSKEGG